MRHTVRGWAVSAVLLTAPASAQLIVSTIRGSVTDPTGSPVGGAELKVVNLGTNIQRIVASNGAGEYEVSDLASGSYRLTATHAGFKTFIADNVILENTQIRRVNVTLELGAVSSEVTVRADAALITTDTAKIQGTFTSKRFDDAPWVGDGRNPQTIMTTLPLVQATTGVYGIQLAGQPDKQVQTAVDGVPGDGSSLQASNVHVMQEVDIVTGSNSAEFSRPGYISMVTKGGTNQFHGRAVYWHQNSALSDRNFFDTTKPKNLFHTMDAEISGPAIRNRTFFFFSWSGQRWPSSTFYLSSVPTEKMRAGDFSELAAIAKPVMVKDPLTGTPFPGNVIPSSRLNATSLKVLQQFLPGPNLGGGALANNFGFLFPYPTDLFRWDSYDYRVDHKLTEKNTIWARLLTSKPLYVLAGNYPAFTWTRIRDSLTLVVEDTHIFSPGLVNTARFGLYRPNIIDGDTINGVAPIKGDQIIKSLGIEGVNPQNLSAMGFPRIDISGYNALRETPGGVNPINKNWDYADSLTWARGRHVLKFGGEFRYLTNFSAVVPEGAYGYFTFNGNFTNYGFADFLLGAPFSSQRLNPLTNRTQLDNEIGVYAQDSFKVNNRLTRLRSALAALRRRQLRRWLGLQLGPCHGQCAGPQLGAQQDQSALSRSIDQGGGRTCHTEPVAAQLCASHRSSLPPLRRQVRGSRRIWDLHRNARTLCARTGRRAVPVDRNVLQLRSERPSPLLFPESIPGRRRQRSIAERHWLQSQHQQRPDTPVQRHHRAPISRYRSASLLSGQSFAQHELHDRDR